MSQDANHRTLWLFQRNLFLPFSLHASRWSMANISGVRHASTLELFREKTLPPGGGGIQLYFWTALQGLCLLCLPLRMPTHDPASCQDIIQAYNVNCTYSPPSSSSSLSGSCCGTIVHFITPGWQCRVGKPWFLLGFLTSKVHNPSRYLGHATHQARWPK